MNLVNQGYESPPPYEEWAHSTRWSIANYQLNSGYAPVQYNLAGQNPQKFYDVLVDASNHPSEIFSRMADALFFHMDQHCNQFRGTQCIEPAKIAWLGVALGQDTELSMFVQQHLLSLYDAASIPYTFNDTQTPVLDRRGHLHLCVFEVCADPAYAQQKWNKMLNILKLRDPLINFSFPTPIPCSAFPSESDFVLNQVYTNWQTKVALHMSRQTSREAMPTQHRGDSAGNNTQHASITAQAQQAVPIARRTAFQTMQHIDSLQSVQAAKGRLLQLETSQNLQARTLELARMAENGDGERRCGPEKSPTVQVQQAVPVARLAAFQTVQQFERLRTPGANSLTQSETLQNTPKASDTQAAPSRPSGVSRGEMDKGRNKGLHKPPTAQAQQAVSIARRAASQTVQQTDRLQKKI